MVLNTNDYHIGSGYSQKIQDHLIRQLKKWRNTRWPLKPLGIQPLAIMPTSSEFNQPSGWWRAECLGKKLILPIQISRGRATIGSTQQAVARRQHSRAALGGTADELRWLAEYGKNHAVSLTFTHVNERDTDLIRRMCSLSLTLTLNLALFRSTACSPCGRLYLTRGTLIADAVGSPHGAWHWPTAYYLGWYHLGCTARLPRSR